MDLKEIIKKVESIFRDILEDNNINLVEATTSDDIEDWDSLTHVQIVMEIQHQFCITFSSTEILSWNNVGEMCRSIQSKL